MVIERKIEVLHRPPTSHGFFNGYGGVQVRAMVTYLFGYRVRVRVLESEDVPHWHYVQQRTLGCSEWRSRLLNGGSS